MAIPARALVALMISAMALSGCESPPTREQTGAVLGGVIGGIIGSEVGHHGTAATKGPVGAPETHVHRLFSRFD